MIESRFFEKLLENISKIDEDTIKNVLSHIENERMTFKIILDALEEGIIVFDLKNQLFIFLNEIARKILNIKQNTPFPLSNIDYNNLNKEIIDNMLYALNNSEFNNEFYCKKLNRYYYIEKLNCNKNISDYSFVILQIKDITEKKQYETQIKDLESVSALNNLAAGIAHEIKNPLTAIDLHTKLIKKGYQKGIINLSEEVLHYIDIVDEETQRLLAILKDFLTATRKRELKITYENLNDIIKSVLDVFEQEFIDNSIEVRFDKNNIPNIFIDKDLFKQVIINLVKNAIDSLKTKKKLIKDFIPVIEICVIYNPSKDILSFSIKDNGIGIEEDKIKKIFEPYYTTKESGTGLGLTIVYKIVKEHGGEIFVESSKDNYAIFTIVLPTYYGRKLIENSKSNSN